MVDLIYYLLSLLFFDIPLLYYIKLYYNIIILYYIILYYIIIILYYISNNLLSFFSGYIYLSFGISISFFASSKLFCERNSFEDFFETFVILSAILLPIKSPVASAVF